MNLQRMVNSVRENFGEQTQVIKSSFARGSLHEGALKCRRHLSLSLTGTLNASKKGEREQCTSYGFNPSEHPYSYGGLIAH